MTLTPVPYYGELNKQSVGPPNENGVFPNDGTVTGSTVRLLEAVGPTGDVQASTGYVHLLATDEHSPQDPYGYVTQTLNSTGSGIAYTYERWVRVEFSGSFNTLRSFRFWVPNLKPVTGWTFKYGTTTTYQAPVNTASSVATLQVPTSDPGSSAPNAGGAQRLFGTGLFYSDWIVMQASADLSVVGPGPVLGFSVEATLIEIDFRFNWTEN